MKQPLQILLILLVAVSCAVGQAAPPKAKPAAKDQASAAPWCEKDPRSDVANYCNDLYSFQQSVNANPDAIKTKVNDAKADSAHLTADLGDIDTVVGGYFAKLDLSNPKSVVKFITVTGTRVALDQALAAASPDALNGAGQQRLDRQTGANATASGTTTLVSKVGSSELLSLALDTGAMTQSVNGTTSTLSTNADQVFRLVTGSNPDCTVQVGPCKSRGWFETWVLNPTNVSATLNLAQQGSTTTPTTGQASGTSATAVGSASIPTGVGKLSGITARYEARNPFDPRSEKFKEAWKGEVKKLAPTVKVIGDDTDAVRVVLNNLKNAENDQRLLVLAEAALADSTGSKLTEAFDDYFSNFEAEAMKNPALGTAISKVMQDRALYRTAWFKALDDAVGNMFTFEYDYGRSINQPETHDFKIIYARDFKAMGMLTFNGALSIYGTLPVGAKYGQVHYGQISTEYDRTLTGTDKSFQTQLSLAGYWQYQPHPSVLNIPAGTVAPGTTIPLPNGTQEFVGTAGSLWITQAKLTLKSSGNLSVPVGVSWSNKTDLLEGTKVGGQVGISYNFSSLKGLFTGGSGQ